MTQESQGRSVLAQGRIVWVSGDLFKGRLRTDDRNQPKLDAQGNQQTEYGFGLAVPKANVAELWDALHQEAYSLYPSGQLPPGFAMKFKDGDTDVDQNGQPYSNREGYTGHIVLACTTMIPIRFFKWDEATKQNVQINEGVKCGDYVNVQLQIRAHGPVGQGKAGLYVNPLAVQFMGYGKEISNAPSAETIFGGAAPALPQGASPTPVSPTGSQPLVPTPQAAPAPGAPSAPVPGQPAQPAGPHYGVLPQAHQPAQAPAMPQAPGAPAMPAAPQFNASEPMPNFQQPAQNLSAPQPAQAPAMPQVPTIPQ